jgi:signal transduction histidine kinase
MFDEPAHAFSGSTVTAVGIAMCGALFAFVGLNLPRQRHYLLLAAGVVPLVLWWGLAAQPPAPEIHMSSLLALWLGSVLAGLGLFWAGLARHFVGADAALAKRVEHGIWLANGCAAALLLVAYLAGGNPSRLGIASGFLPQTLLLVALGLRAHRKEPGGGHLLPTLALALIPLNGVHEIALHGEAAIQCYFSMVPFMATCIAVLPAAFTREQRRLEDAMAGLESAKGHAVLLNIALEDRERDLVLALQTARAGDLAKSRFLNVMHHEIRTPMTGLMGNLDLLARQASTAQQQAMVDAATGSARMLQHLLNNITTHARLLGNQLSATPIATPVFDRLQASLDHWRVVADGKQLQLQGHFCPAWPVVQVDEDKLLWIVNELIANALKFTDHGAVDLVAQIDQQGPPRLVIEVHDSGCGVPADRTQSIFSAFEQGDTDAIETRQHGGAGLGLAIAVQMADCLGGHLTHSHRDGGGSIFRLTVPVANVATPGAVVAPALALAGPLSADDRRARWTGKQVLVVDDNAVVRKMLSAMLKGIGVDPVPCQDAAQALLLVQQHRFDAVLMDISMPGMSGLEASRRIRVLEASGLAGTAGRHLPIIGISAHAPQHQQRWRDAGMSAFLSKPITSAQLSEALDAALA